MNTIRKLKRSTKALSPVVASIILIAVTVAVSIAVAAWMGALTVGFMGSSSMTVTNVAFDNDGGSSPVNNVIVLTMKNTGTKEAVIAKILVNNKPLDMDTAVSGTLTFAAQSTDDITLTYAWISGDTYKFDFYDGSNQVVGSFQATSPGS
jgi:flagellin-like protein